MSTASELNPSFDLWPLTFDLVFRREGIDWTDIEWVDNAECLDLVERVSYCELISNVVLVRHIRTYLLWVLAMVTML